MYACHCRQSQSALVLIERLKQDENNFINTADFKGNTPLRVAATRGTSDVLEALLACISPGDVDHVDKRRGRSALHLAAWSCGSARCVTLLLDFGADPTLRDKSGQTALDICYAEWLVEQGRADEENVLATLIRRCPTEACENSDLVGDVAAKGSIPLTKALLDAGADFYKKDSHGWHALLHAIGNGHDGVVALVLQKRQSEVALPSRLSSALPIASLSEDGLEATCDLAKATRESDKDECVTIISDHPGMLCLLSSSSLTSPHFRHMITLLTKSTSQFRIS